MPAHNWLIEKVNRRNVERYSGLMKGVVYDLGCGEKPYQDIIQKNAVKYIGVDWGNTLHNKRMDIEADLAEKARAQVASEMSF